jgi:hypothetical protein
MFLSNCSIQGGDYPALTLLADEALEHTAASGVAVCAVAH